MKITIFLTVLLSLAAVRMVDGFLVSLPVHVGCVQTQTHELYAKQKQFRSENDNVGNNGKRRRRRNMNIDDDDDEKTVVLLYHKKKGLVTSHSNNDCMPIPSVTETADTSSQIQIQTRTTVYDDIMGMKGYIPSQETHRNSVDTHTTSSPSPSLSFQEATGIRSKLHAIGRLDADTTGLLLLTNDGGLVHHVTNPTAASTSKKKVVKTYEALIMGYHTLDENENENKKSNVVGDGNGDGDGDGDGNGGSKTSSTSKRKLKCLLDGVDIGKKYGGMTLPPDELVVLGHPTAKTTLVKISISEGKNRQVRRMFHAINSGVIRLHRSRVGRLDLSMLGSISTARNGEEDCEEMEELVGGEGSWRVLTDQEVWEGLGWKVRSIHHHQGEKKSTKPKKRRSLQGSQKKSFFSQKQKTRRRRG